MLPLRRWSLLANNPERARCPFASAIRPRSGLLASNPNRRDRAHYPCPNPGALAGALWRAGWHCVSRWQSALRGCLFSQVQAWADFMRFPALIGIFCAYCLAKPAAPIGCGTGAAFVARNCSRLDSDRVCSKKFPLSAKKFPWSLPVRVKPSSLNDAIRSPTSVTT